MEPKRGGSRIPIDDELVAKLALLNPSNNKLAYALGISRATLLPAPAGRRATEGDSLTWAGMVAGCR
jgi:hypothetical protein